MSPIRYDLEIRVDPDAIRRLTEFAEAFNRAMSRAVRAMVRDCRAAFTLARAMQGDGERELVRAMRIHDRRRARALARSRRNTSAGPRRRGHGRQTR